MIKKVYTLIYYTLVDVFVGCVCVAVQGCGAEDLFVGAVCKRFGCMVVSAGVALLSAGALSSSPIPISALSNEPFEFVTMYFVMFSLLRKYVPCIVLSGVITLENKWL